MLLNIIKTGGIGCVVFTIFLFVMSKSGVASAMRDEKGNFKKLTNLKAISGVISFVLFLFGLLFFGNVYLANLSLIKPDFFQFWLNAFGVFFIVHLYDLIVLDFLIIIKWHPSFLKLPDTEYYNTFMPHFKGFLKGIPIGVIASFIVALISMVLI